MKIISLFSGIGAFEKALSNLNIECEIVNYCEIDKFASKSYSAIHGISEDKNLWDIQQVDEKQLPYVDLITYGFPCQDISVAGKRKGINENTRSGLLYEALRIIESVKPKYAIAENVKNLVGKKFKGDFEKLLGELEDMGYNSYWKVLNAKDYGVPQNRERVFIVSIRKDVDDGTFEFPEPFDSGLRLKHMLEDEVDEKFYISDKALGGILNSKFTQKQKQIQDKNSICSSLLARDYKDPKCVQVGELDIKGHDIIKRVYSSDGLCPTITTMGGGNQEPKVLEENKLKFVGGVDTDKTNKWIDDNKSLSRNYKEGYRVYDSEGVACCQKSDGGGIGGKTGLYRDNSYRIRKLTPKECWWLMGFNDEDIEKCIDVGISNTQLYRQAGNSIVVDVLMGVFYALIQRKR